LAAKNSPHYGRLLKAKWRTGLNTKVLEINPKQKAIIVSGFSKSDRVRAAQALGAGAYVRKPYVIEKAGTGRAGGAGQKIADVGFVSTEKSVGS